MILHTKSNMTSWMGKHFFLRENCIEKESDGTIIIVSMLIVFVREGHQRIRLSDGGNQDTRVSGKVF